MFHIIDHTVPSKIVPGHNSRTFSRWVVFVNVRGHVIPLLESLYFKQEASLSDVDRNVRRALPLFAKVDHLVLDSSCASNVEYRAPLGWRVGCELLHD